MLTGRLVSFSFRFVLSFHLTTSFRLNGTRKKKNSPSPPGDGLDYCIPTPYGYHNCVKVHRAGLFFRLSAP
ncbi:hypothetical protein GGI35DRAFT_431557 [Trichoderma velutinum]